jgi:hypothetical protein
MTNRDLLAWFAEDERGDCSACGERACVSFPEAAASFCLACGAITIDGVRMDVDGVLGADGLRRAS